MSHPSGRLGRMSLIDRFEESAKHAVEVHLSACIMFEETKWRRTHDARSRDAIIADAVREACDALIRQCEARRLHPTAHDYNPG